jgi:RNA ligase (TIGR02306 family)
MVIFHGSKKERIYEMSSKNLATVQVISEVLPHDNADRLELAIVKGWQCVVGKGNFKSGDRCVYIQLDSIVPEEEQFEFLRKQSFRVRTMKLRGKLSQGLVIPCVFDYPVGTDVTEEIGVIKYEKPIPVGLDSIGAFPTHYLSHTDEERLQNIPELIDLMKGKEVYASLKHDGTSSTYVNSVTEDGVLVCGRNWMFPPVGDTIYASMYEKYDIGNRLPEGFAIQGEIVGPGVQKNHEGLTEKILKVFNVKDLSEDKFLDYHEMKAFCLSHGFDMVQTYHVGEFHEKWWTIAGLLAESDAARYDNGGQAEGIVWRLAKNVYCPELGKDLSFKVVSNKFMLKNGE